MTPKDDDGWMDSYVKVVIVTLLHQRGEVVSLCSLCSRRETIHL